MVSKMFLDGFDDVMKDLSKDGTNYGTQLGALVLFNNGVELKLDDGSMLGSDERFDVDPSNDLRDSSRDYLNDILLDCSEIGMLEVILDGFKCNFRWIR